MSAESKKRGGIGVRLQRLVSLAVGDSVAWDDAFCPVRGGVPRTGVVLRVHRGEVELDMLGTRDWRSLSSMKNMRVNPKANDIAELRPSGKGTNE